jgi:hypothetical protein
VRTISTPRSSFHLNGPVTSHPIRARLMTMAPMGPVTSFQHRLASRASIGRASLALWSTWLAAGPMFLATSSYHCLMLVIPAPLLHASSALTLAHQTILEYWTPGANSARAVGSLLSKSLRVREALRAVGE